MPQLLLNIMYNVVFSFTELVLNYGVKQRTQRCASHVGRRGGRQEFLLGRPCFSQGVLLALMNIRHELLHAVGFLHEMNRFRSSIFNGNYFNFLDLTGTLT